jgi:hypothetical protein
MTLLTSVRMGQIFIITTKLRYGANPPTLVEITETESRVDSSGFIAKSNLPLQSTPVRIDNTRMRR